MELIVICVLVGGACAAVLASNGSAGRYEDVDDWDDGCECDCACADEPDEDCDCCCHEEDDDWDDDED